MYSTNGRHNKNKESASKKIKNILVCKDCGNKMHDVSKEFGEQNKCAACGSSSIEYETN